MHDTHAFSAAARRLGRVQSAISQSVQSLEATLGLQLFDREMKTPRLSEAGRAPGKGTAAWQKLWDQFVPPYDVGKFPNKWRKMEPDLPARTLMAHLGKDSYSHIHYDSAQQRTISVREAARLQSFPDGFIFRGTMNPAFRQIGNAVPPLLAKAVAERMLATLRAAAPGDADVVQRAG